MEIQINKGSEVPVKEQLAEKVIYLIATGKWKASSRLPSVRELARRLGVHHNTVSEAYSLLVERGWLVRRRGARLTVRSQGGESGAHAEDFKGKVADLIQYARRQGWTRKELHSRIENELAASPADHILLVETEPGLRELLHQELNEALAVSVQSCSLDELWGNPSLAAGAQVVVPNYLAKHLGKAALERPLVELQFGTIETVRQSVANLKQPSIIAIASVSPALLAMAKGLFGPAEKQGHTLLTCSIPLQGQDDLKAADVIFCDVLARKKIRSRRAAEFRLLSEESLKAVAEATSWR